MITKPQRLKKLLRRLVDIYSPSGKEEEILHFLRGYLKRHGLPVISQPVDDNRYNLLVTPSESDIRVALIGHVDTVAAYDLEDYISTEQGDILKGLGTADMKSGCAAMVEAYIAMWESGRPRPPVALCLVVGEEEEGDGTKRLVKGHQFPWAIIGEPTDLKPCLSIYGYLEIQLGALGRMIHASLANRTQNPIEAMLRLMLKISQYVERQRPELVYNIRDLFSSRLGFVVPDRCEAWLDVHLPPSAPIGVIATELEEIVAQEQEDNPFVDSSFQIVTIDSGYELPEKGPIVEALKAIYAGRSLAWKPEAFRSHSDANQLWATGIKTILLGPGKLEKAHAPDESVSFQQVCLAADLYLDFLMHIS
jgi:acetylornithine deacetylase